MITTKPTKKNIQVPLKRYTEYYIQEEATLDIMDRAIDNLVNSCSIDADDISSINKMIMDTRKNCLLSHFTDEDLISFLEHQVY